MKNITIEVPAIVIEESDLEGISDEGRVNGDMEAARQRLQSQLDRLQTVSVGLQAQPRGDVPWVKIGSGAAAVRLFAGEAMAFLPSGPTKIEVPPSVPPSVPEEKPKPAPVKKATKKKANG